LARDNEPESGGQPFIVSLTFGAERQFEFRHKKSSEYDRVLLRSGTLLIMQPDFNVIGYIVFQSIKT